MSRRPGQTSFPMAASKASVTSVERQVRPSANQAGAAPWPIASLVTGQALLKSSTAPASGSKPRHVTAWPNAFSRRRSA